ncbi:MAG: DUF4242 domain-containing protein [Actinobacteria bacterium]|nr:MAG: DUF4242 domain-containing protein [Actinomycetota bacterium]
MTKFLVERRFHVAESEMPNIGRKSRQVIEEQFPEITWHHSHVVVDDEGTVKSYCVYEAPSEEIVRRHSAQLGLHVVEGIYEIAGDVTPDDFPPS